MGEQPTAVAVTGTNAVAPVHVGQAYVTMIMEQNKREFLEANDGLDLDYVRFGDWLKLNKKGNFVEASDDSVSYGDNIDVVVGQGEKRYMLWGKDNSPEKGQLIVAEHKIEEAHQALEAWLGENEAARDRYSVEDIDLRYLAFIVMVDSIAQSVSEGAVPKMYIMDFPPGDTIAFGKYAKSIFDGKYKNVGVPSKNGVNRVVTRISSEERKNKDNETYLGRVFDCIGLFNPVEYGIAPDQPANTEQSAK